MAYEDHRDQWVSTVGDMLKTFPSVGSINPDLDPSHAFFHDALTGLKVHGQDCCLTAALSLRTVCFYDNIAVRFFA